MVAMLVKDLSLLEEFDAEDARLDFKRFVVAAWPQIEPGRPFTPGWHLDAIAEHLEAVSRGEITRLLVNMPPRHGKSSLISVLWSAWLLLNDPSTRLLCASYAMNLATRDNLKTRRLIKSPWFRARYGNRLNIVKDQDAKIKFETTKLGYRMAVSVGSSATGEGGDILILDDPHNIDEKESDTKRESAIDWFNNTWSTRLNDQRTGKMVTVGQRIHMGDVSGHIRDTDDGECVFLNLPAEFDPQRRCVTPVVSSSDSPYAWKGGDPRREEGELLWTERFPPEVIEKAKSRHGPLGYSALYGQDPIPPGGFVFSKEYERLFAISPQGDMYILITPEGYKSVPVEQCWEITTSDVAAKDKEINDFTVFEHWAITPDNDVLLLDLLRGHWSTPKQKEHARLFYHTWLSHRYMGFWFEDVGYQSAIAQDLLLEGMPCLEFHPQGDKVYRAGGASIWQQTGKVYFRQGAVWLPEFQKEIYTFPLANHDDQVDPFSMVCMIVRDPGIRPLNQATARAIQQLRRR